MLLVCKDKKKKQSLHKGRIWNGEIKFEPVLFCGTCEGVGNARIGLWKPLNNNDKLSIDKSKNVRKRRKNQNSTSKNKRKSQVAGTAPRVASKQSTINKPLYRIKSKEENSKGNSSTNHKSKYDPIQKEKKSLPSFDHSKENEEYFLRIESSTRSNRLKYGIDDMMTSDRTRKSLFPHNLIEYQSNIEEENNAFKSHASSDYANQNKNYIISQYTTESEPLKNIPEELLKSDLKIISNSESIFLNTEIQFPNNEGENKLFKSQISTDNTNRNKEYVSSQFTTETEVSKNIPENSMKSNLNYISTSERIFLNSIIEFPNDDEGEKKVFESLIASDDTKQNKEYIRSQFTIDSEALKNIPENSMKSNLNYISTSERIFHNSIIEFPNDDEGEKKVFESLIAADDTKQNKEYIHSQFTTDSEALKNISNNLMKSNLNNLSISETIFPNSIIDVSNDEKEKKLFESQFSSDNTNRNKEYVHSPFITESEILKNIQDNLTESDLNNKQNSGSIFPNDLNEFPNNNESENKNNNEEYFSSHDIKKSETLNTDKLIKPDLNNILNTEGIVSDLIGLPSNNIIYPNTSIYTGPNSMTFISLENLTSESDEFYQNIKKNWSLDSSKVLMTPSKGSVASDNSSNCDSIKVNENSNTADFIQLTDAIEGNLNDIINEHQFPEQTVLKPQNEEKSNLNNLRNDHQLPDEIMELQHSINNNLNDYQYKNQTKVKLQAGENDNQFSNNINVKFVVLKKSRENQETILDSSEQIEKNIFTRNNISPDFENLITNTLPKTWEKENKLSTDENKIDNAAKIHSLVDVLHGKQSKNYGVVNIETKVQLPKVSQEPNISILNNENFTYSNNLMEAKTVKDLFKNGNIQASDDNIQKAIRGESKYEMPLNNSEDEDKNIDSSFVPTHAGQKYFNTLSEYINSLAATTSNTITMHDKEISEHGLKFGLEETSDNTSSNPQKKNMGRKEDIDDCFFKHSETNFLGSSRGSNNNFPIESKKPKYLDDDLQYHLISKSKHSLIDMDRTYSEIEKRTDEMINKIMRVNTYEELLLLMKPNQKTKKVEKNDEEEALITKSQQSLTLIDKREPTHSKNELLFQLGPEGNLSRQDIIPSCYIDNIIKTFKKEVSDKEKLNKQFFSSNCSLDNSSHNLQSILTTPSSSLKDENFRIISEEKEKSSLIMNLKKNQMQTTHTVQDSIINGSLSNENSTSKREENIQNTNLYFASHVTTSPYMNQLSKHNITNFENEKKNSVQEKFFNCFRKINFWSKKKSTTSLRKSKSDPSKS
ncbi:unnamed protein product [Nezara viridula]|uniref:Uncharacterized protein n=1 Tax=Nezara viridula TaxID=85310 RepID=A0A9P0H8M6_NEZVI|nr:unnamed protein product [Nezara viridula]